MELPLYIVKYEINILVLLYYLFHTYIIKFIKNYFQYLHFDLLLAYNLFIH